MCVVVFDLGVDVVVMYYGLIDLIIGDIFVWICNVVVLVLGIMMIMISFGDGMGV